MLLLWINEGRTEHCCDILNTNLYKWGIYTHVHVGWCEVLIAQLDLSESLTATIIHTLGKGNSMSIDSDKDSARLLW